LKDHFWKLQIKNPLFEAYETFDNRQLRMYREGKIPLLTRQEISGYMAEGYQLKSESVHIIVDQKGEMAYTYGITEKSFGSNFQNKKYVSFLGIWRAFKNITVKSSSMPPIRCLPGNRLTLS
jgi:hypothetical protein